jgi:hypothetical protein
MSRTNRKWIAALAVLAAGTSGVANAAYITTFTSGMTTQVEGASVFDFDTGAKPAGYSGEGWVLPSSVNGMAAAPAGDNTPYLSVAFPNSSGIETFQAAAGTSYNYFGLYWGSIDDYNKLRFYSGDTLIASVSGLNVLQTGATLGDQISAGSNRYVNFFFGGESFDRIEFETTNFAFESDNHAVASVPEPATSALLGTGIAAFMYMRRRREKLLAARG